MLSKSRIKYIQSLSLKKYRDINHCFIIETPKVIDEFLRSDYKIRFIVATDSWINEYKGKVNKDIEIIPVTEKELKSVSLLKTPHQVVAIAEMKENEANQKIKEKWTLCLDDIQDPGNMGTIIRIADWFGIKQIICSRNTASAYNPKVVQATMGSLAHVDIRYVDLKEYFKDNPSEIIATTLDGDSIYDLNHKIKGGIILIGNEGNGISDSVMKLAKYHITIPKIGHAESLNAGVATGIILSHLVGKS